MKPQRILNKDYEELLKTLRRWPQPYLGLVAKLIGHISYQFSEIQRLDARLKTLEQTGLMEAEKVMAAFPGASVMKPTDPMPRTKQPKLVTTPAERIKYIFDEFGADSKEWMRMLKVKALRHEEAIKLIETVK